VVSYFNHPCGFAGLASVNTLVDSPVKPNLRVDQKLHLLRNGGRRTLLSVRSVLPPEYAHMSFDLVTRIGQGLLAIAATGATVVVLQVAMLA
jgi:hypothetical protein